MTTHRIANTIYFLACDASAYITGDMIWVAGGTTGVSALPPDYFDRALGATVNTQDLVT